jgi:hypothetical protein
VYVGGGGRGDEAVCGEGAGGGRSIGRGEDGEDGERGGEEKGGSHGDDREAQGGK